jgi:hypothetical protein
MILTTIAICFPEKHSLTRLRLCRAVYVTLEVKLLSISGLTSCTKRVVS